MKTKSLQLALLTTALGIALLAAGCIISGQFILVYSGTATIESTNSDLDPREVDITQEDLWQDHKDDIQGIEDIKFECEFVNNTDHTLHGELYISSVGYTTVQQVRDDAIRVFSGLEVLAGETKPVSFSESSAYIENLDTVLDLLESGHFWLYGIVPAEDEPYSMTIQGKDGDEFLRLMITFSAGT